MLQSNTETGQREVYNPMLICDTFEFDIHNSVLVSSRPPVMSVMDASASARLLAEMYSYMTAIQIVNGCECVYLSWFLIITCCAPKSSEQVLTQLFSITHSQENTHSHTSPHILRANLLHQFVSKCSLAAPCYHIAGRF